MFGNRDIGGKFLIRFIQLIEIWAYKD